MGYVIAVRVSEARAAYVHVAALSIDPQIATPSGSILHDIAGNFRKLLALLSTLNF